MNSKDSISELKTRIAELEFQLGKQLKISNALKERVKQSLQNTDGAYSTFETNLLLQSEIEKQTYELQVAREIAESSNHTKNEFLASMSHEMRTPLHAILGFAEMGEKKSSANGCDKLASYFEHINASGKRLLHLLNDLLDLAKFDSGELRMNFKNADLRHSVNNIITQNESLLQIKSISVEVEKPDFTTIAYMDIERIEQVVQNLLSNAIKFTNTDSIIRINFKLTRNSLSAPSIQMSISDEGMGIPEGELELVFDKFIQSTKTHTTSGGTGLGLAICKEIIKRHLGDIWAENNSPNGATFIFNLPIASRNQPTEVKS